VIYSKNNDLYLKDATGGGSETEVFRNANPKFASDWSRDGRFILYTEVDPKTLGDIWYLADPRTKDSAAKPVRYLGTSARESQAQFSPDGRWVAYFSDESGKPEVYVRPFPSGPGQWKVSTNGGREPRWSSDGKEIYYLEPGSVNNLMAAGVRSGGKGTLEIGTPQKLFEYRGIGAVVQRNVFSYSPAANDRFLVSIDADTAPPTINLITNWQKLAAAAKADEQP
jgi:eukaryotic-like serine/threonine-protein kinase